ncbi:hypothetical protein [Propionicimonas sp.]|uniref:hypothetical protein n=1 Tax=Propionicimonas sp. TaxID=1955623 RepID=UPI0039E2EAEF
MARRPRTPTPWWVPVLLGFLGLTACFLTIAYLTWVWVNGQFYWLGIVMVALNLAATVAAVLATGMDARTGRVSWRWWTILGLLVLFSMALFGFMDRWAPR